MPAFRNVDKSSTLDLEHVMALWLYSLYNKAETNKSAKVTAGMFIMKAVLQVRWSHILIMMMAMRIKTPGRSLKLDLLWRETFGRLSHVQQGSAMYLLAAG